MEITYRDAAITPWLKVAAGQVKVLAARSRPGSCPRSGLKRVED